MTWKLLQCIMEEFYPIETGQSLTDDLNQNAGSAILVSHQAKRTPLFYRIMFLATAFQKGKYYFIKD